MTASPRPLVTPGCVSAKPWGLRLITGRRRICSVETVVEISALVTPTVSALADTSTLAETVPTSRRTGGRAVSRAASTITLPSLNLEKPGASTEMS